MGKSVSERKLSRAGEKTRDRIIDAALETVRSEGLIGASVRVIARTGDFNQGLVFYHFGSVEELLLAALERVNATRIERYRERLLAVDSLPQLVQIAVELQAENDDDCDHSALSAIVAGWSASSDVGKRIAETLRPWDDLVETALKQSLAGTPFAQIVPTADMAHAVSCLFLGAQIMSQLDPDDGRVTSLFTSLLGAARMADPLLESMRAEGAAGSEKVLKDRLGVSSAP